jgi:hypothetical protein
MTRSILRFTALLVGALLITGCAKQGAAEQPPAGTQEETSEGLGGTVQPVGGSTQSPPPPAPGYPSAARGYAEATLTAYVGKQTGRLADLTTAEVNEQLVELPGALKTDWLYLNCDGVAGGSYCAFRNSNGDVVTLKVSSQRLGAAHAVVEAKADLTTFPAAGEAYARAFVLAWAGRNTPRMRVLGTPDVVTKLNTDHPAPAGYQVSLTSKSGGAGLLLVTVPDGAGGDYVLHVGTTKLGHPHAVVGYES